MKTIKTITALFAIGLAFSSPAEEADIGERFYLGVGGAQFRSELHGKLCQSASCSADESRAGVMLYGGYRASEYFGAEIGGSFVNGFSARATEEDVIPFPPPLPPVTIAVNAARRSEYRNIYAAGTGRVPVLKERLFLTGKLGAHYYRRKDIINFFASVPNRRNPGEVREDSFASGISKTKSIRPFFGAGVELQIGRGGLRAEWTKFYGKDNDGMEVIAVNYIYRF